VGKEGGMKMACMTVTRDDNVVKLICDFWHCVYDMERGTEM
jgi:hypothetical protein